MNTNTRAIPAFLTALLAASCVLPLAGAFSSPACAQAPVADPSKAIARVAQGADERLAKSVADLNALREQIAAEKLPLSQELTGLEERVTELRKENDRMTRLVDEGALEMAKIKQEIKARQDELVYVGNLLDEYARNFETKANPVELQVLGASIAAAKDATENKGLAMPERLGRQTTFVDGSIARAFDMIGGNTFAGVGVDMLGTVAKGQFALIGPVALFRADSGLAGIAVPQAGSDKPLIRPLEGALEASVGPLVATGSGTLALDPSRGGALKALVQKTNLVHIFIKGGPIMWPILVASILALAVVIERVFFLLNDKRKRDRKALNRFFGAVEKGQLQDAIAISGGTKDCIVNTLGYALEHREHSLDDALMYAKTRTLKRFRRGIPVLDTVITLAPLLGLLGTVTGMMGSFAVIGGDLSSPGAITGGIAEALIATAAGLGIAIMCLLPFNYLNAKIEEIETEVDQASAHVRLAVERAEGKSRRVAHAAPVAVAVAGGV
jgi:biopolymer transport protein ExbB